MPDREKVIKGLESCATGKCEISCPYHNVPQCTRAILVDALALLNEQPQIVRCKDCKHNKDNYYCPTIGIFTADNWFCADGEALKEG